MTIPLNACNGFGKAQTVLHEELHRLPENLRAPLVLCYLESATQEEAARQLGWSVRTFKRRLDRARQLLQLRLTRRALTLPALLSTDLLAPSAAPAGLIPSTLKAAVALTTGGAAATISAPVVALVNGLSHGPMLLTKAKTVGIVVLAGLLGTGLVLSGTMSRPTAQPENKQPEQQTRRAVDDNTRQAVSGGNVEEKVNKAGVDLFGDSLPSGAIARLGTIRFRHDWRLDTSAVSLDGRLLAGAGTSVIQVWDAESGKSLHRIQVNFNAPPGELAFSQDSKLLASYAGDKKLRLIDMGTGKITKQFELNKHIKNRNAFTSRYHCLEFLPNGRSLLLADAREATVRLIDIETGQEIRAFPFHGNVALAHDAKAFAVADANSRLLLVEIATGKELLKLDHPPSTDVNLAFGRNDKMLAAVDFNGDVHLWDLATGKLLHTLTPRGVVAKNGKEFLLGPIRSVNFSPDGRSLLATHGGYVVIWDVASGKEIRRLGCDGMRKVIFYRDGKLLLAMPDLMRSSDHMLTFLDAQSGKLRQAFDGHRSGIKAIAFSPDGRHVATCDEGDYADVRIWETSSARVVFQEKCKSQGPPNGLAFSLTGDILAAGDGNDIIALWDWKNGKLLQELPANSQLQHFNGSVTGHGGTVTAFSPDLRLGARTMFGQETVVLWDLASGKEWKRLEGGAGTACYCFSSDGRTLLRAGSSPTELTIWFWEVATGELHASAALINPGGPECVAFSGDGCRVAISVVELSKADGRVIRTRTNIPVYDLATDRIVTSLVGHTGGVSWHGLFPR